MDLPQKFLDNMRELLGGDYDSWLASYDDESQTGLRINTTKLDRGEWERLSPYGTDRVPWISNGYYCSEQSRPAKDPYYFAGLYYLQEPSAMTPAAMLPVKPGDRVLDLCAAPGGKSTELGARLCGQGLLVANDISSSRARALLKNLELFGIPNICVTSETPKKLADTFGAYFDAILVDAPCSGEGMFRRDPSLIRDWEEHGPEYYAPLQREILKEAVRMLRPGGYLLYSTCTFAKMEDEDNVEWLLRGEPGLRLSELPRWEGSCPGADGQKVIRLFPHRLRGEGHFVALFQKNGEDASGTRAMDQLSHPPAARPSKEIGRLEEESDFLEWERLLRRPLERSRMMVKEQMVYYLPECFDRRWNLRYLRTGLLLGEWKKKRFEPSQAVAMVLQKREFAHTYSMDHDDERVIRYLKGETIFLKEGETLPVGWILVCVGPYPLGWAKFMGSSLKNKYYPGWRWQ